MAAKSKRTKTTPTQRREAVRLLRILAERETDPGGKGYTEGVAELIEEGISPVRESYLERLRRAVADGDSDNPPAAAGTRGRR